MLTLRKTLDKGLVRTQDSPVTQNSLPAARQAWGRSELAPALLRRLERELRELSLLQRLAGKLLLGGLGTGPTGINMFPSRFRQTPGTRGGSKLEPPNRWAEHCSEIQTGRGLDYQKGSMWKELEHGLLVSFPRLVTV